MPAHLEIFRRKALEHYQDASVAGIYPRFFSFRILLFCWSLFFLLLGLVLTAWSWNITQYAQGIGIIQSIPGETSIINGFAQHGEKGLSIITLFFPAQYSQKVQYHALVQIKMKGVSQPIEGIVDHFDPSVLKPEEVHQRYHLSKEVASDIVSPVVVVQVDVRLAAVSSLSIGSRIDARLPIGTFNLFALF
jgi:hypothetical protein